MTPGIDSVRQDSFRNSRRFTRLITAHTYTENLQVNISAKVLYAMVQPGFYTEKFCTFVLGRNKKKIKVDKASSFD